MDFFGINNTGYYNVTVCEGEAGIIRIGAFSIRKRLLGYCSGCSRLRWLILERNQVTEEKFREEIQFYHWTINILFLLVAILFVWAFIRQVIFHIPFGAKPVSNVLLIIGMFFTIGIPLLFGRMVTMVTKKEVRVSFGYMDLIKKRLPISDIKEKEIVRYKPLRQFGGWGIRCGRFRGERVCCYSAKGNKGALITLSNNRKIIIGSQVPEKLFSAIGR